PSTPTSEAQTSGSRSFTTRFFIADAGAFALNELAATFLKLWQNRLMMLHRTPGALVWPAAMIVWGPAFTAARHSHHCFQLVMVMHGTLRIRSRPRDKWKTCGAALVRPDASHEVEARGGTLLIGFVDAESELGAALGEKVSSDISCIP